MRKRSQVAVWAMMVIVFLFLVVGCDGGVVGEPVYPSLGQAAEAVEALMDASPEGELPEALGPAVEEVLVSKAPVGSSDAVLVPPGGGVAEFICGTRMCACADGENIPDHLRDKWSCDGMGAECTARGYVPKFPCTVTSRGLTICVCINPETKFR